MGIRSQKENMWKNCRKLTEKKLYAYKQLQKEIKNLIIFNSAKISDMQTSKEAKLIICIAFFCSKFMICLEFEFWPHAVQAYERQEWK